MKNLVGILLVAVTVFVACKKEDKKDDPPTDNSKKYAVQFDVSGFSQTTGDINSRQAAAGPESRLPDSLKGTINYILYKIWDATTELGVKKFYQSSKDTGFGRILDTLPAGRYVVTVIASRDSVFPATSTLGFDDHLPSSDIFYKRLEFSVDGAVNQGLSLDRIVAKITVVITDRMPYDIGRIYFYPPYDVPNYLNYYSGKVTLGRYGSAYENLSITVPDSAKGKTNFKFETYLLKTDTSIMSFRLVAGNAAGTKGLGEKPIFNVKVQKNTNTILTGTLFDAYPSDGGTHVIPDTTWGQEVVKVGF